MFHVSDSYLTDNLINHPTSTENEISRLKFGNENKSPGESFELKFIPNQSEYFRTKHFHSDLIRRTCSILFNPFQYVRERTLVSLFKFPKFLLDIPFFVEAGRLKKNVDNLGI